MSALERRFESRLAELHEQTRRTLSRSTGNGDAGNAGSLMWDPDEDEKARARAELERELETLVAVRAMSGADAKRWRERFDAATARDWSLTAADHKLSRRAQKRWQSSWRRSCRGAPARPIPGQVSASKAR